MWRQRDVLLCVGVSLTFLFKKLWAVTAWWKVVNRVNKGLRWESRREELCMCRSWNGIMDLCAWRSKIKNWFKKKKNQLKTKWPMVLDCTEGSNCICTHCPSCVLPWSLVHFFHSVVNMSKKNKNKTCYQVYTHQHWLKEEKHLCHVKKKKKSRDI